MEIAIRIKSFQFEKSARKLKRFWKKVTKKVENRSSIPRCIDISAGGDSGERGWRTVSEFTRAEQFCRKKCRICKRVIFYKEEIDIAIRIKSFQFVQSARMLKSFGNKYLKRLEISHLYHETSIFRRAAMLASVAGEPCASKSSSFQIFEIWTRDSHFERRSL